MTSKSTKQIRRRPDDKTVSPILRQIIHDAIGTFAIVAIVFVAVAMLSWATTTTRSTASDAPVQYDLIER